VNLFGNRLVRPRVNRSEMWLASQSANPGVNPAPTRRVIRVLDPPLVVRCLLLLVDPSALRVVPCPHLQDVRSVRRVVPCLRHRAVRVRPGPALAVLDMADRARARRDLQEVLADLAPVDLAPVEHSAVRALVAVREHPAAAPVVLVEEDAPVADLVRVADAVRRAVADVDVGAERTISSRR
jgi:hypothetical protein